MIITEMPWPHMYSYRPSYLGKYVEFGHGCEFAGLVRIDFAVAVRLEVVLD